MIHTNTHMYVSIIGTHACKHHTYWKISRRVQQLFVCVCVCVCACVRACVRACVCVCFPLLLKLEKTVTNNKKNIYRTHILVKEVCVLVHTIQTIRKISPAFTSYSCAHDTNNKKNIYRTHILVKEVCVLVFMIQTIRKISTELTSL